MSEVYMCWLQDGSQRTSHSDNSGLHVPSSGRQETLKPEEKGNKIPTGQEKWGDGGNWANLIEVTSRPSRYPQQPDMMS